MQIFAVVCLAAVALARPQSYNNAAVTTVTERTFTIRGEADKYHGTGAAYSGQQSGVSRYSSGYSGYTGGVSGYAANQGYAQPAYSFETVASAVPVTQQQSYQQSYQYQAVPYQTYQAAYHAVPVTYQAAPAAPVVAYQTATAAPVLAYQAAPAAPAVTYHATTTAPVVAYAAAPAVAYQTATAAPAVAYQGNYNANYKQQAVGVRAQENYGSNYETSFQNSQVSGAETKIFKHVYAFAAPEEPSSRATVRVQAPVSKRKHYKLVFIKTPSHQTVLDSDITLPAQEEEKTLIYVLSKNQKQQQPEIRIKQAGASTHTKPEVFFLKYKTEAEAQAIANSAISGQSANVPAQGEIISDGSVSILGQSSSGSYDSSSLSGGSSFNAGSSFNTGSSFNAGSFNADSSVNAGASYESDSADLENSLRVDAGKKVSNVVYRGGYGNAGLSAVSAGSVGIVSSPVVATTVAPVALVNEAPAVASGYGASSYGASSYGAVAGFSGGFPAYSGRSNSFAVGSDRAPASVSIKVTSDSEPSDIHEATTAVPL